MKNVVIFFLFLCVYLVGACNYVHASASTEKFIFSPELKLEKPHQVELETLSHNYLLTENIGLTTENDYLNGAEDEDENEDIIKKHISQSRYFLAFCYTFILNHRFNFLSKRFSSCGYLSCTNSHKYIFQRALRI